MTPAPPAPFGRTPSGGTAYLHAIGDARLRVRVATLGASLVAIEAPDRAGRFGDVLLGLASAEDYLASDAHLGATVGRYANRIGNARFTLDGTTYALARNAGANTLHGGPQGFDRHLWTVAAADAASITLCHVSPDGDQGFPGTLAITVAYAVADGALTIRTEATTDKPTVLNPMNHAYFNLAGEGSGDVYDHEVTIYADAFTPTDADQIPTGEIRPVVGTPLDLRAPAALRPRIRGVDPQLRIARGFDHNYVLPPGPGLRVAASARDPSSGRRLTVSTDRPGLQFYTGNSLDGAALGRSGRTYRQGDGLCFEAQAFPDAPNRPAFPSTVLRPGERFTATTVYAFATD